MAKLYGEIASSALMTFDKSFARSNGQPLDSTEVFYSKTAAEEYAAGDVAYVGQKIVVIDTVDDVTTITHYGIEADSTLKEIGSVPVGDGKSVEVVNGKIQLKSFGSATAGQQLRIGTDGNIEWFTPDTTTVEGLNSTVAGHTSDIANLQENKANKTDVYTKDEVDGKLSSVYHYKGSVSTYAELPTDAAVGDVYNVDTADKTNGIKAGDNVAWNGTAWDVLAGTVDLSAYATTEALTTGLSGKVDKNGTDRLMTADEGTKLAGIEEGAQVNVIETVDETQFSITNKNLTLLDIAMSKVTGLTDALNNKVDKNGTDRLMTEAEGTKLAGISSGAQANVIEHVKINGGELEVTDKAVDIPIAGEHLGVIKSSDGENEVSVSAEGVATVAKVNVNTLVQTTGETLILNGGSSSV